MYNPHSGRQIFCFECKKWFHLRCLKNSGSKDRDLSNYKSFPAIRGPFKEAKRLQNWAISGQGKAAIKLRKREPATDDLAEQMIGKDLLDYVKKLRLPVKDCPECQQPL